MGKNLRKNCEECQHSYMNRCCMCLDIRTGVIILGLIHLVGFIKAFMMNLYLRFVIVYTK